MSEGSENGIRAEFALSIILIRASGSCQLGAERSCIRPCGERRLRDNPQTDHTGPTYCDVGRLSFIFDAVGCLWRREITRFLEAKPDSPNHILVTNYLQLLVRQRTNKWVRSKLDSVIPYLMTLTACLTTSKSQSITWRRRVRFSYPERLSNFGEAFTSEMLTRPVASTI